MIYLYEIKASLIEYMNTAQIQTLITEQRSRITKDRPRLKDKYIIKRIIVKELKKQLYFFQNIH